MARKNPNFHPYCPEKKREFIEHPLTTMLKQILFKKKFNI